MLLSKEIFPYDLEKFVIICIISFILISYFSFKDTLYNTFLLKSNNLKQDYTKETINEFITIDQSKIEMLKYIKSSGLKTACVTNSINETCILMLQKVGIYDLLDFIVCNNDVKYPKPNSEGWIQALVKFNCYPSETIICEDSDHGFESAKNTGAFVWRVKDQDEVTLDNFKKFKESIEC